MLRLDIADFRNLTRVKIEPLSEGFNLLYGDNGSGKTSVLEAIYYLSLGRSFRSSLARRVVSDVADKFSLFTQIQGSDGRTTPVGLERYQNGDMNLRIAGNDKHSISDLAALNPIQLIHSMSFNLLESPHFRRKYLDWGVFYQNPHFLIAWKQYMRALKQRNAALRHQLSKSELNIWSQELIVAAEKIHQMRIDYINNLVSLLNQTLTILLPNELAEISYQQGWSNDHDFAAVLERSVERDRQVGHTQFGPHRADLKININKVPAKDILSRGQQKLFVCAMIVAQGNLLQTNTKKKPIYLVDDLPAELDEISRGKLMALFSQQRAQIFVTAVERKTLEKFLMHLPTKMFHVEHGSINEFKSELRLKQSTVE